MSSSSVLYRLISTFCKLTIGTPRSSFSREFSSLVSDLNTVDWLRKVCPLSFSLFFRDSSSELTFYPPLFDLESLHLDLCHWRRPLACHSGGRRRIGGVVGNSSGRGHWRSASSLSFSIERDTDPSLSFSFFSQHHGRRSHRPGQQAFSRLPSFPTRRDR